MVAVSLDEILQVPLFLKQGGDATILLTVVDNNKQPITNPAGWTARAQIRAVQSGPVLFEWNTSPGAGQGSAVLLYDSVAGVSTLELTLTKAQSINFTWWSAQWDVFLTNPSGLSACVAEGTVSVDPAITQ